METSDMQKKILLFFRHTQQYMNEIFWQNYKKLSIQYDNN